MATKHTLTITELATLAGNPHAKNIRAYVVTNLPKGEALIDTTTNEIMAGGLAITLLNGSGSVSLPATDATDLNVVANTVQYEVRAEYVDPATRGRETWRSGYFALTADANLADVATDASPMAVESAAAYAQEAKDARDDAVAITGITSTDPAVAALINTVAGPLTQAALANTIGSYRGKDPRSVDPNVDLTGVTDARATIQSALAFGDVVLPRGNFKIIGDLNITAGGSSLSGLGDETQLRFVNGGLVIDGDSSLVTEVQIHGLSVRRTGTAGPAIRLKGGGSAGGPVHVGMHNVRVQASTGDGLLIDGAYIGTFTNCYFMGAAGYGIKTQADSVEGTVYANNLSFVGGEIASNANAMYLDHAFGISFYGCAIEGNTTSGVEIPSGSYGIVFDNCYVEANGAFDLKIGTSGICWGVIVRGGYWTDFGVGKAHSIIVERGRGLLFDTLNFLGYSGAPIYVNEDFPATVWGEVRNCTTAGSRTGVLSATGADEFNKVYLGKVIADGIRATQRTPASTFAAGEAGEVCWDANYIYVCTTTNNWKRAALSTW